MTKDEIRERLIALLETDTCNGWEIDDCEFCQYVDANDCFTERTADHLLANGVTIQRWIPVSERLPKEGQSVLVYRESKKMIAPHVSLCTYHGAREKNEWSRRTDHVMCWMPLPQSPKEET